MNEVAGDNITVYVIDDDPSVRRGLVRFLKAYDFDVLDFASPRDLLVTDLPDANACLIIDMSMPDMNGLQLFAELRRRGCQAPAIFLTALDDPELRDATARAGAVGFFRKPASGDELVMAIRKAVGRQSRSPQDTKV